MNQQNKDQFNLCIVHERYEAEVFNELVNCFAYGLKQLGYRVYISVNQLKNTATNIIIGSHISPGSLLTQIPKGSIVFNTEQVYSVWFTKEYIELLKNFKVWDYSQKNIELLKKEYGIEATYNPIGYCPFLERIDHLPEEEKDIDVLFYGSMSKRRADMYDMLKAKGLNAHFQSNVFAEERDRLIARSKIVINMHYNDIGVLETTRLSYLLTNKCFVITERSSDWKLCPEYQFALVMSEYNWIPEDCMEYINAPLRRKNVADCGYQLFKEFAQEKILKI